MSGASKDLEISAWHDAFWHGACSPVSQDDLQAEAAPESDATEWQASSVDETNMRWGFWRDLAPGITTIVNSTSIVVVRKGPHADTRAACFGLVASPLCSNF